MTKYKVIISAVNKVKAGKGTKSDEVVIFDMTLREDLLLEVTCE